MPSSFISHIAIVPIVAGCLFFTSCAQKNYEKLAPTAPVEPSLQQTSSPVFSPTEVALLTNNFAKASSTKSTPPQRIAASTAIYAVIDLGTLGGEFSAALDMNASGQIVGAATLANGVLHPFLYENGQMLDLGTLGGTTGLASGIVDNGDIVGQADNAQGFRRGFLYRNGVMTEIPTLGGSESRASGINASGQIVGQARIPNNSNHAYLYENGQMSDLGTLGGTTSWANNINATGGIIGGSHTLPNQDWHAYSYDNGVMTDLGTLGGLRSVAFNLNDVGQVAGWSEFAGSSIFRAVLWNNGAIVDLGTLGGESIAYDVNNSGQIVGHAFTADNRQHAFLINNGPMQDLNDLIPANSGWELSLATEISHDGRKIIGRGIINGQNHAFLLTLSPAMMIDNLIDLLKSFDLPMGIENSLLVKLEHAEDAINAGDINGACNQLNAFINEVNAQAGKKLTLDQASELIEGANQIRAALGCL